MLNPSRFLSCCARCGLLAALVGPGCIVDAESTESSTDDELAAETTDELIKQYSTWPKSPQGTTEINVCFTEAAKQKDGFYSIPGFVPDPGDGPGYRDWIVDAILDSWARVTNMEVKFFDSCPSNTGGWVVIHFNENNGENAEPGYLGPGVTHDIYLNQNEGQGLPPEDYDHYRCGYEDDQPKPTAGTYDSLEKLRNDAMHEFGHILGFGHNMDDPDLPTDVTNCRGTPASVDLTPGDYDYGSVMDYCTHPCTPDSWGYLRPNFRAVLSDYDVWNAQRIYGTKRANGQFIVGHRNHVIEIPGSNAVAGQKLEVFQYKGGTNERWSFASGTNRIVPLLSPSLSWDVVGATTSPGGTPLQLYPSLSQPNQSFRFEGVEVRGLGGNCLEALGYSSGSKVELRRCNGAARQAWNVDYGVPGHTRLKLAGTSLCIASPVSSPSAGLDVVLQYCSTAGTRAKLSASGGALRYSGNTGLCLDTEWGDPAGDVLSFGTAPRSLDPYDTNFFPTRAGRKLQFYTCKTSAPDKLNQQYHVHGAIKGLNGYCVDIKGGTGHNGAPVQMYPCHGGRNQLFDAYIF